VAVLSIAVGGAAGAVVRYLVDGWIAQSVGGAFPWGTLVINVSGSLALGFVFALALERGLLPASIRGPAMIGFLGAYTTFSTLMLESWQLLEGGAIGLAVVNLGGSIILGVSALAVGLALGRFVA
jgi:CrcB protein